LLLTKQYEIQFIDSNFNFNSNGAREVSAEKVARFAVKVKCCYDALLCSALCYCCVQTWTNARPTRAEMAGPAPTTMEDISACVAVALPDTTVKEVSSTCRVFVTIIVQLRLFSRLWQFLLKWRKIGLFRIC